MALAQVLIISGEKRFERESSEGRYWGPVIAQTPRDYRNGVLKIGLPKAETGRPRGQSPVKSLPAVNKVESSMRDRWNKGSGHIGFVVHPQDRLRRSGVIGRFYEGRVALSILNLGDYGIANASAAG